MDTHLETTVDPGDHLDHYQVDRLVARGSETVIFHGVDLHTGREVAIKVPLAEMEDDPTFADRFRREQQVAESLDHPGIAKVISDPARTKAFMVLEWSEGKTLRQLLTEEKRLAADRAVRIAASIAHALEYLHAPRDPASRPAAQNVMVDAADRVKLIDFGGTVKTVARRLTFTKMAQSTGASDYISPEELLGKRADARSDLYALGIILYEMLTGELPFSPARPMDRASDFPSRPAKSNPAISPQLQEVSCIEPWSLRRQIATRARASLPGISSTSIRWA